MVESWWWGRKKKKNYEKKTSQLYNGDNTNIHRKSETKTGIAITGHIQKENIFFSLLLSL